MAKILIAEDSKDVAFLTADVFKSLNHEVTICYNGQEAIDTLEKQTFDLVLTDIIMPQKDGIDVINFIKKNKLKTYLVAMTSGGLAVSPEHAEKALSDDVDAFLKKPISLQALLDLANKFFPEKT